MKAVQQEERKNPKALRVAYLTPDLFDYYWPQISVLLDVEPDLWSDNFTKENIVDRVRDTSIQVWVVFNGEAIRLVFFTQRYVSPNGQATLQIFWMYGTGLKEVMYLLDDTIDRFAATLNCSRLEVCGRKGFERFLAPLGAKYRYTTYSRPVRSSRGN